MPSKSSNNRTITIKDKERTIYNENILSLTKLKKEKKIENITINSDFFKVADVIPKNIINLAIVDPLYNIDKDFGQEKFKKMDISKYEEYTNKWFIKLLPMLAEDASVYICCDWSSSTTIFNIASKYLIPRNRITWEREKGRGSKYNWKNCLEDIWFFTVGNKYTFNVDSVKLLRKVVAPYKDKNGNPKDWFTINDQNVRITYPSNIWNDITIPFWSMPENTVHPTQKPEKLIAKLILASSNPNDLIIDPFMGSGTTSVVCKKLNRKYIGIEIDKEYCLLAEKRLYLANIDKTIQGYNGKYFYERNLILSKQKSINESKLMTV